MFSEGTEKDQWYEMGQKEDVILNYSHCTNACSISTRNSKKQYH